MRVGSQVNEHYGEVLQKREDLAFVLCNENVTNDVNEAKVKKPKKNFNN